MELSGNTDSLMEFKVCYSLQYRQRVLTSSHFNPFCYLAPPLRFIQILLHGQVFQIKLSKHFCSSQAQYKHVPRISHCYNGHPHNIHCTPAYKLQSCSLRNILRSTVTLHSSALRSQTHVPPYRNVQRPKFYIHTRKQRILVRLEFYLQAFK